MSSLLFKNTNPEHAGQLVNGLSSNRANGLLINKTITVTLYNNLLTFRDTGKKLALHGDLLKLIIIKNYNVDLANLSERKIMHDFAKKNVF